MKCSSTSGFAIGPGSLRNHDRIGGGSGMRSLQRTFPLAAEFLHVSNSQDAVVSEFPSMLQLDCCCLLRNSSRSLERKPAVRRSSPATISSTTPPTSLEEQGKFTNAANSSDSTVATSSIDSMTGKVTPLA